MFLLIRVLSATLLIYVMELATEAVSSEDLIEALAAQGIDNISTSGIRIITTVNKGIQEKNP